MNWAATLLILLSSACAFVFPFNSHAEGPRYYVLSQPIHQKVVLNPAIGTFLLSKMAYSSYLQYKGLSYLPHPEIPYALLTANIAATTYFTYFMEAEGILALQKKLKLNSLYKKMASDQKSIQRFHSITGGSATELKFMTQKDFESLVIAEVEENGAAPEPYQPPVEKDKPTPEMIPWIEVDDPTHFTFIFAPEVAEGQTPITPMKVSLGELIEGIEVDPITQIEFKAAIAGWKKTLKENKKYKFFGFNFNEKWNARIGKFEKFKFWGRELDDNVRVNISIQYGDHLINLGNIATGSKAKKLMGINNLRVFAENYIPIFKDHFKPTLSTNIRKVNQPSILNKIISACSRDLSGAATL